MQDKKTYKSGIVSIIGRPNSGKSTLLNKIMGEKLSITSPVAQTTKANLRGIYTTDNYQIVWIDTPGIHQSDKVYNQSLSKKATGSISGADVLLVLHDLTRSVGAEEEAIFALAKQIDIPILVAVNKIDIIDSSKEIINRQELLESCNPHKIYSISAKTGLGIEDLVADIAQLLPVSPALYPDDIQTDQHWYTSAAEIIREQVLYHLRDEIPHMTSVEIDTITDISTTSSEKMEILIVAKIIVTKKSQKAIMIGKNASMIKKIRQAAQKNLRKDMWHNEASVKLELTVDLVR